MFSLPTPWPGGLKTAALALLVGLAFSRPTQVQNTRITDFNRIGWATNTTTLRFAERWSGHLEYQFRRDNWLRDR